MVRKSTCQSTIAVVQQPATEDDPRHERSNSGFVLDKHQQLLTKHTLKRTGKSTRSGQS